MKKHPVDDLFVRKLADWQPKASPDLLRRLEDRQKEKSRRLVGWYWYAAASVALVLMAGYVVWQSQSPAIINRDQEFAVTDRKRQPKVNTSDSDAMNSAPTSARVEVHGTRTVLETTVQPGQRKQSVVKVNSEMPPQTQEPETFLDRVEVVSIQKKETTPESLMLDSKSVASLQPLDLRPEIMNEGLAEQNKGRVIIAHIETDNLIPEDPKSSKFIRILRQLKNAKQGEAIEWDEVGFNPKKLMARADERLKNEEEKVSKKYQELKDKTKL